MPNRIIRVYWMLDMDIPNPQSSLAKDAKIAKKVIPDSFSL